MSLCLNLSLTDFFTMFVLYPVSCFFFPPFLNSVLLSPAKWKQIW